MTRTEREAKLQELYNKFLQYEDAAEAALIEEKAALWAAYRQDVYKTLKEICDVKVTEVDD